MEMHTNLTKLLLPAILVFSFIIRVTGIHYGLPLTLVSDEPPFTLAALKMLDLRTLVPALHENEFKSILYLPPCLTYAYLPFFTAFLGAKYVMFHGALADFKNYILSDLTPLFLIARFMSVLLGTATVWLLYRLGKRFFESEITGLAAAALLATSILHTALSLVGKDWVPAVFLFILGVFVVTDPHRSSRFRYLLGAAISGIAFGVSLVGGFIMVFMLLWYLFAEHHSLYNVISEPILYGALVLFLTLASLAIALHPGGFHLAHDNSIKEIKSFEGLIKYPGIFFSPILLSEPILIFFAAFGLFATWLRRRPIFWIILLFSLSYLVIFYFLYHPAQRFAIYLFPFFALLGGAGFAYGFHKMKFRMVKIIFTVILLIPALAPIKLVSLALKNDPRTRALHFIQESLPEGTKIATYARLFSIPPTKESLEEQKKIDVVSIRQTNVAQADTPTPLKRFHALNLATVDTHWLMIAPSYLRTHGYQYLALDPSYAPSDNAISPFADVSREKILAAFAGGDLHYSITESTFGNIFTFLKLHSFGPDIEIHELTL